MKGMKKTIGIVLVIALIAVGIYTFVAVKSETSSDSYSITAMNQDLCFERNAGVASRRLRSY